MSLSLQEILTQALGFLLLLFVMKRVFWKPLLAILEGRRSRIEEAFQKIDSSKKEIEGLRATYETRLEKIEQEAHAKLHPREKESAAL